MKKFIYFLVELDGRCRQIINGIVTSLYQPKQLDQAPDGNQEIAIGWERSPDHGTIPTFSLPLGFVMDGGAILRNDFYKFNLDRQLFLLIKRLTYENTALTYKEYYKQLYKGELDWATADDNQGDARFNINIMQGGLLKLLKASEGIIYEIPFDIDAKNVSMNGMFIVGQYRWFLTETTAISGGYISMFQMNNDNPVPGLAIFDIQQRSVSAPDPGPDENTLEYFAQLKQDIGDVNITGTIVNITFNLIPLKFHIIVFNTITNTQRLDIDLNPVPYPQNYNLVINETINLLEGDRVFIYVEPGPFSTVSFSESYLYLSAKSKPIASVIKGFTIFDLGMKLVEKITGSGSNFESTLLAAKNIILTSGDGIRSLPNAAIKTSWRDYKKAVDVYCKSQVTISDKVKIESRNSAYDSTQVPIALGEVKNFKCTPAIDMMGTSVKVGHAEQQVDDTNGKFDFNGFIIFSSPVKAIPDKQIDLQSPYKASPWEIENIRANYEGKTTTDKISDNDVYALAVLPNAGSDIMDNLTGSFSADGAPTFPGEPLLSITDQTPVITAGMKLRFTGTLFNNIDVTVKSAVVWFFGQLIITNEPLINESIVGFTITILEGQNYILDRTPVISQLTIPDVAADVKSEVYNVSLSPKRILLLHKDWLAGMLYDYSPGSLIFSSANRNKELIADGIIEKADVPIADLGAPAFINKYFEFDTVSPVNMTEIFEATLNPVFSFLWKDVLYTGFFIRGGIALNDREEQTFKLLACPENNMLSLI